MGPFKVKLWKVIQNYSDIPDEVTDIHTHFKQFKVTLQTEFKYLKQATTINDHNLYTNLTLQQAYTSTLRAHIKNIDTKLGELQGQIQQHCMYPHTSDNNCSDVVQLLAPEFDPDIDGDNQPTSTNNNQPQYSDIGTTDVNHPKTENTQTQNHQPKTNWPDTLTIQIPWVSLTVQDQPPEIKYIRRASTKLTQNVDIPNIEEDEQDNYNMEYRHRITHLNTFQESKRIRQEYSDKLQDVEDQQYFQQIDQSPELTYYLPRAPYHEPQVGVAHTAQTTTPPKNHWIAMRTLWQGMGKI